MSSFRPRLRTVSIIPGIENLAPERTLTRSGFAASPKPLPVSPLDLLDGLEDVVPEPVRELLAVREVVVARFGRDREAGRDGQPGVGHLGEARRPCRRAGRASSRRPRRGLRPRRRCSASRRRGSGRTRVRRTWPLGEFLRGSGACAAEQSSGVPELYPPIGARPRAAPGTIERTRTEPEQLPPMTDLAADARPIEAEAPQYNASLVRREDMTESLAYFWVRFDGEPTPFEAGQYMTIGVMADGRIVQRPYSVASPPVVAGTDGYEFYVRLRPGWDVHAAAVAAAPRPQDADDRPEGQVHAPSRRRSDAHLHLVRDRQRTVRLDDAPGPP